MYIEKLILVYQLLFFYFLDTDFTKKDMDNTQSIYICQTYDVKLNYFITS